jgi:hypothetical protein
LRVQLGGEFLRHPDERLRVVAEMVLQDPRIRQLNFVRKLRATFPKAAAWAA